MVLPHTLSSSELKFLRSGRRNWMGANLYSAQTNPGVDLDVRDECDVTPHLRISDTDIWVRSQRSGRVRCFPHLQEY